MNVPTGPAVNRNQIKLSIKKINVTGDIADDLAGDIDNQNLGRNCCKCIA